MATRRRSPCRPRQKGLASTLVDRLHSHRQPDLETGHAWPSAVASEAADHALRHTLAVGAARPHRTRGESRDLRLVTWHRCPTDARVKPGHAADLALLWPAGGRDLWLGRAWRKCPIFMCAFLRIWPCLGVEDFNGRLCAGYPSPAGTLTTTEVPGTWLGERPLVSEAATFPHGNPGIQGVQSIASAEGESANASSH